MQMPRFVLVAGVIGLSVAPLAAQELSPEMMNKALAVLHQQIAELNGTTVVATPPMQTQPSEKESRILDTLHQKIAALNVAEQQRRAARAQALGLNQPAKNVAAASIAPTPAPVVPAQPAPRSTAVAPAPSSPPAPASPAPAPAPVPAPAAPPPAAPKQAAPVMVAKPAPSAPAKSKPAQKASAGPAAISESKDAALADLLKLYKEDKITPLQYQERRHKILVGSR